MFQKPKDLWRESFSGLAARHLFLFAVMFVLVILSSFPFRIIGIVDVKPAFILSAVYYWAIIRPQNLSYLKVFITGVVLDLLIGAPLGLSALSFVAVMWLVSLQRRFLTGQPFRVIWAGFIILLLGVLVFQWFITAAFYGAFPPLKPYVASAIFSVIFFPLFTPFLMWVNKILAGDDLPE